MVDLSDALVDLKVGESVDGTETYLVAMLDIEYWSISVKKKISNRSFLKFSNKMSTPLLRK